jgi:hypothetical protein
MNRISKKLALILMILSSNALIAYEWTFRNLTTKPLVVALKLQAWGYTYYDVINPGENTSRFSWPIGSWKAGFCISTFLVGEMTKQDLRNIFGKTSRPTMEEIAYVCGDTVGRDQLARVGKSEIPIKWISGERWGLFDKSTRAAVKALTKSITGITEEAVNLAVAAGAEAATSGTTGGTAGAAAYKLKLGKIFAILDTIPGTIMDLAYKSRCTARHFDIIEKRDGSLVANTKDE